LLDVLLDAFCCSTLIVCHPRLGSIRFLFKKWREHRNGEEDYLVAALPMIAPKPTVVESPRPVALEAVRLYRISRYQNGDAVVCGEPMDPLTRRLACGNQFRRTRFSTIFKN